MQGKNINTVYINIHIYIYISLESLKFKVDKRQTVVLLIFLTLYLLYNTKAKVFKSSHWKKC